MEDLRVETYDTNDVEDKKKLIKKRVILASGAILVTLGLFGLTGCDDTRRLIDNLDPRPTPMVVGGSGSWFLSILMPHN